MQISRKKLVRSRASCSALSIGVILALLWIFPGAVVADETGAAHGGRPGFGDAEYWAKIFDDPERLEWQKPRLVMQMLSIRPGLRVADIGAGTGFFTHQLAMAVGSHGRVYSVEIEPSLLEYIDGREDLAPFRNRVVTVLGEPDDPKLPAAELDVVLVVNTWHHISGRVAYIKQLRQSLNADGRVVIIDWRAGELPMGPPPERRLPRETVIAEFEEAGWTFDSESVMLPYQYLFVFEPPR